MLEDKIKGKEKKSLVEEKIRQDVYSKIDRLHEINKELEKNISSKKTKIYSGRVSAIKKLMNRRQKKKPVLTSRILDKGEKGIHLLKRDKTGKPIPPPPIPRSSDVWKPEKPEPEARKPKKTANRTTKLMGYAMLTLLIMAFFAFFYTPQHMITGHTIFAEEYAVYNESVNYNIEGDEEEKIEYNWAINSSKGFYLRGLAVTGRIKGNGSVRMYLTDGQHMYLVLDNTRLNTDHLVGITGHVVHDAGENSTNTTENMTMAAINDTLEDTLEAWNDTGNLTIESTNLSMQNETADEINNTIQSGTNRTTEENESYGNITQGWNATAEENINQNTTEDNASDIIIEGNMTDDIQIALEYNTGTLWDEDDNGITEIDDVVDLTVDNTVFRKNLYMDGLCTRWQITDLEEGTAKVQCYGSELCCNFVGVAPKVDAWNAPLFVMPTEGTNLNVTAQVMYVDYSLDIENPYKETYYSEKASLPVSFMPVDNRSVIEFEEVADMTSLITEFLDSTNYTLIFEVEEGTKLEIDKITYALEEFNATKAKNATRQNITNVSSDKIKEDIRYEAVIDSSEYNNDTDTLKVRFHHDSPWALPLSVKGKVRYSLDKNVSRGGENVTLTVYNWSNRRFRIIVGTHTEAFEFGIPRQLVMNASIKDAEGRTVNATVEMIDSLTDDTVAVKTEGDEETTLTEGEYRIKIGMKDNPVKEVMIDEVGVYDNLTDLVDIDDVVEEGNFSSYSEVYALDPTRLNFTKGTVKATAKGRILYKCRDWNFTTRTCPPLKRNCTGTTKNDTVCTVHGGWQKVMALKPGENYTFTITPADPAYAEYDGSYGAPYCNTTESPCVAETSDLRSRDSLSTPEPNQPNTIDSCTDGTSGSYTVDENVENITITTLDGDTFTPGDNVQVDAWVYCWSTGSSDNINIVYTSDADNPSWTVKAYEDPCPAGGFQKITKTFALDDVVGNHAVRVINQYSGSTGATCGTGSYDDNDDVVFAVSSGPPDTTPPIVTALSPEASSTDNDGLVTFQYTVTDPNSSVSSCELIINGSVAETDSSITEDTTQSFTHQALYAGNYTWHVNCTSPGGENTSGSRPLTVADAILEDTFTTASFTTDSPNTAPWERGSATQAGGCYDDSSCWGTNLDGNYAASGPYDDYLTSAIMDFSDHENITLWFYHYRHFEDASTLWDAGVVDINNGSGWTRLTPDGGYNGSVESVASSTLGGQQAFGYYSSGWELEIFDLSAYDGQENVQVRFHFAADEATADWGWFIDRLRVSGDSDAQEPGTVIIEESVTDAEGNVVETTLSLRNSTGKIVYSETATSHSTTVKKGIYEVDIEPQANMVDRVLFHNVNISENLEQIVDIDNLPEDNTSEKRFAVNPLIQDFTNATVTLSASPNSRFLWKCTDYNFTSRTCNDSCTDTLDCTASHQYVKEITGGQQYNFTINATDPLFTETVNNGDALVYEAQPNNNYGSLNFLGTRSSSAANARFYIQFTNLSGIPDNQTITDAQACFYYYSRQEGSGDRDLDIHHVLDDTFDGQNEGTITWNNQVCGVNFGDSADCNLTASDTQTVNDTTGRYICWNVTEAVSKDYQNSENAVSFGIKDQTEGSGTAHQFRFRSRNYLFGFRRPYLDITYENLPPTHTSPLLTSSLGTNTTDENLTCYNQSTSDPEGAAVKNIFNWKIDGNAFAGLNMPFEGGSNSTYTKDYSGNNNDGTVNNAAWNSTGGHDGKGAYEFDGTSADIPISDSDTLSIDDKLTISAWVKDIGGTGYKVIASKTNEYLFRIDNNAEGAKLSCFIYLAGWEPRVSTTSPLSQDEWHHVACIWDNSTGNLQLYVDGRLNATTASRTGSTSTTSNALTIGSWLSDNYWNGTIDDLTIYKDALSQQQIKTLYNNRTNLIVSQETSVGENWTCEVTPNDIAQDGSTLDSNNLTVLEGITCVNLSNPSTYQGKVVNVSGTYYINSNVTLCTGVYRSDSTLMAVNSSDIYLDCRGSSLIGNLGSSSLGILVYLQNNVSISNCTIHNFSTSVQFYGSYGSSLTDSEVYGSSQPDNFSGAVLVFASNDMSITDNHIHDNNFFGVVLGASSNSSITGNSMENNTVASLFVMANQSSYCEHTITNNTGGYYGRPINYTYNVQGITLENIDNEYSEIIWCGVNNSVMRNVNISNGPGKSEAILFTSCSGNSIYDIDSSSNYLGMYMGYSEGNNISNTTFNNNAFNSIIMDNSTLNIMSGISANSNGNCGISIENSYNNSVAYSNLSYNDGCGIELRNSDNIILSDTLIFNNSMNGIYIENSDNNSFYDNTLYNNLYGVNITGSDFNYFTGNNINANINDGIYTINSEYSSFFHNNISNNSHYGISLRWGNYSIIVNNTVSGNAGDGIESVNSSYLNVSFNTADLNGDDSIDLYVGENNWVERNSVRYPSRDGVNIPMNTNSTVLYNNITDPGQIGVRCDYCYNVSITGNNISEATAAIGSAIMEDCIIEDNHLANSTQGIYCIASCTKNNFTGNTAADNKYGIYVRSTENIFTTNTVYGSTAVGIYIWNSTGTIMQDNIIYGNKDGFYVRNTGASPYTYNMTGTLFLPASGELGNYTNLSVKDSVEASAEYAINWTTNRTDIPSGYTSFAGKYVDISTEAGDPLIEEVTWRWNDSELSGYNESNFRLWKYNSTSWQMVNGSPDTANNNLKQKNMSPSSIYGILHQEDCRDEDGDGAFYSYVPGACTGQVEDCDDSDKYLVPPFDGLELQDQNQVYTLCPGTYNVSPSGYEGAVSISNYNITLDCNGTRIIGDGTGTLFEGYSSEMEVRNCIISNYSRCMNLGWGWNSKVYNNNLSSCGHGMYLQNFRNSQVYANTITQSEYGMSIYRANNSIIYNNTVDSSISGYYASNQYLNYSGEIFNNGDNTTFFVPDDIFQTGGEPCYISGTEGSIYKCSAFDGEDNLSVILNDLSSFGFGQNATIIMNREFNNCSEVDSWWDNNVGSHPPCYYACVLYKSNGAGNDYTLDESCYNATVNISSGLTYPPYVRYGDADSYGIEVSYSEGNLVYNNIFNATYPASDDNDGVFSDYFVSLSPVSYNGTDYIGEPPWYNYTRFLYNIYNGETGWSTEVYKDNYIITDDAIDGTSSFGMFVAYFPEYGRNETVYFDTSELSWSNCSDVEDALYADLNPGDCHAFCSNILTANGEYQNYTFDDSCLNSTFNITAGFTYPPYLKYISYTVSPNDWNTTQQGGPSIIGGQDIGGNFYADYTGIDTDNDGIGETSLPYTSNSRIVDGGDYLPLTLQNITNSPPTHTTPILNSTFGTNLTSENLTCYNRSTSDPDNDSVKNIFNWLVDDVPILVLNMPFEGGSNSSYTKDYSGNDNNGSVSGALWNSTGGYDGKGAYTFNSTTYIDVGNDSSLDITDDITMEAWVKPSSFVSSGIIFAKPHTSFAQPYIIYGIGYSNSNNYDIAVSHGTTQENCPTAANTVNIGQWQHIVATFNGTDAKIYIDGELNSSCSFTSFQINTNDEPLYLGYYPFGGGLYSYQGSLDETRIYSEALSQQQIKTLYNNRTNLIVSQETSVGENWTCEVTPNDIAQDGTTLESNNLTILSGFTPTAGFTVTLPGQSPVAGNESCNATANMLFNSTANTFYDMDPCVMGTSNCQNSTVPFFFYQNTGNVNINISLALDTAMSSLFNLTVNTAYNATTSTALTTTPLTVGSGISPGGNLSAFFFGDFMNAYPDNSTTTNLISNATQT